MLILPEKKFYKEAWHDEELDLLSRLVYHPIYGFLYRHRYKIAFSLIPECTRLLEIGCGHGLLLPSLIKKAQKVYALDAHPYLGKVHEIMSKNGHNEIVFNRGDIINLPYKDGSFDCVVCISVLEHMVEIEKAVFELWRVLKKNGKIIVGFPVKNSVTKFLFRLINRDDDRIHPQDQTSIISALNRKLKTQTSRIFPSLVPISLTFYYAGVYIRDD